ncbi:MAG: CHASE2 domain-containing protein, partial [Alkalispirochaetaceae bacterium]
MHVHNILSWFRSVAKTVYYVPVVLLLALSLAVVLPRLQPFRIAEERTLDAMRRLTPAAEEDPRILFVEIDDAAVSSVGSWPWSRAEIAQGLYSLGEFGPERILLDIEFRDPSPYLVQRDALSPTVLQMAGEESPQRMLELLLEDRDELLGEAVAALGNVYLPLVYDNREGELAEAILPIPPVRRGAAGIGFSNTIIDPDGVSRRLPALVETDHGEVAQLGLAFLGYKPEEIEREGEYLILPETADRPLRRLPVDDEGHFRILWPRGRFTETFRHISWRALLTYHGSIEDLAFNIRLMEQAGFVPPRFETLLGVLNALETAEQESVLEDRVELRRAFLGLSGQFLRSDAEARIRSELTELLEEGDLPESVAREIESVLAEVESAFEASRELQSQAVAAREELEREVEGALVLVGFTATSTTDLGVTPFDQTFANVGVHASVANMVLTGETLRFLPTYWSVAIGAVLSFLLALTLRRASGAASLALGLAGVLLPAGASYVLLLVASTYLPALAAMSAPTIVAVLLLAGNYLALSREKAVVRDAFEHYLAPEVVSQLLEDPRRLDVGGTEQRLTVVMTDVAGFSRIAEQLSPSRLVELLNDYLTQMSDLIMGQGGTIDKYEGDAILAFFGAPVPVEDHPVRACVAALQMKKLESVINNRFIRQGRSPAPLITRIGINTGEMIVGNLGTNRRMNYTVMGHSVNLAARLEGINKTYGTSVCISEETRKALDERFLARRMDRVRAVGMDRPVRLYELVGYLEESTAPLREAVELFEAGIDDFEARAWERAQARFTTVLRIYPDDGPAKLFLRRCEEFLADPPRETWDGVVSLT